MTIQIDKNADAAYIRLSPENSFESEEVEPGVIIDFNRDGKVVAIELLAISERLPDGVFSSVEVLTGTA